MEPDRKRIRIGGMELRFLVEESEGAGDLVMFEMSVAAGARVPAAHHHASVDEAIYGLEGSFTTVVDGKELRIGPGESVFIPRGAVHQHENRAETAARALVVLTPGTIGRRYFEE